MKTTIEIPDPLHKIAKIRAVEHGTTLNEIVLSSLRRELGVETENADLQPGSL